MHDEDGLFDMEKLLEKYDPLISTNGVIYVHNVGIREKTRKEVLSFVQNIYGLICLKTQDMV